MMLIYYEFKKICGIKYIWALLAAVSVVCAGFFYFTSGTLNADRDYNLAADKFFAEYNSDPERINEAAAAYDEYVAKLKEIDRIFFETVDRENVTEDEEREIYVWMEEQKEKITYTETLGFVRRNGDPIPDQYLIFDLCSALEFEDEYREKIEKIVDVAEGTIHFYEAVGAGDDPACEYERHFAEIYADTLERTTFIPTFVHGWQQFFEYDEISIFICLFTMFLAGAVFLYDRSCGTLFIQRAAKNGRLQLAAAKLAAVLILSAIASVVITGAAALTCYFKYGFSSPSVPVQTVLIDCPYVMSIGGYAVVMLLVRFVGVALFTCFSALIASLFLSHIVTYFAGAIVLTVNMVVHLLLTSSNVIPLNLISVVSANGLLSTYKEVMTFGHFHSTLLTAVISYACLTVIFSAAVIVSGNKTPTILRLPRLGKKSAAKTKARKRRAIQYPNSLFAWELQKLFTPAAATVAAVMLVFSAVDALNTYSERSPESTTVYESYVSEHVLGEYTDATRKYLSDRRTELLDITSDSKFDDMKYDYLDGKIDYKKYSLFLVEAGSAEAELRVIRSISERVDALSAAAGAGAAVWLIPETGISRIIGRDINIFLLVAIVFIFSRAYAADYMGKSSESDFGVILRTTPRGRRNSWRAKTLAALAASAVIAAAFEAVDIAIGAFHAEKFCDILAAPVCSIEGYGAFGGLKIGSYIAILFGVRISAYVTLALFAVAISFLVRRVPQTLSIVISIALLPYVLVYMGAYSLRYIDFTAALAGNKLFLRSAEFALFGGTYMFAVIFLFASALLTAAVTLFVRHKAGK